MALDNLPVKGANTACVVLGKKKKMAQSWKDANEKTPVRKEKVGNWEVRKKKKKVSVNYRSKGKGKSEEENEQEE